MTDTYMTEPVEAAAPVVDAAPATEPVALPGDAWGIEPEAATEAATTTEGAEAPEAPVADDPYRAYRNPVTGLVLGRYNDDVLKDPVKMVEILKNNDEEIGRLRRAPAPVEKASAEAAPAETADPLMFARQVSNATLDDIIAYAAQQGVDFSETQALAFQQKHLQTVLAADVEARVEARFKAAEEAQKKQATEQIQQQQLQTAQEAETRFYTEFADLKAVGPLVDANAEALARQFGVPQTSDQWGKFNARVAEMTREQITPLAASTLGARGGQATAQRPATRVLPGGGVSASTGVVNAAPNALAGWE